MHKVKNSGPNKVLKLLAFGVLSFIVIIFVSLYLFISPRLNPSLAEQIMFHPERLAEHHPLLNEISGVRAEEVSFTDGKRGPLINALLYRVPGADSIVLFSHGNAGTLDHRIDKYNAIIDSGVSVLAYDYRGYGKSADEHPTLAGVLEDSLAAYDYLTNEAEFKPEQIILYGESLGSGISTELARKRQCKGIVLESAFASLDSIAKEKLPVMWLYPSFLFLEPTLDNADYAAGKHPPLLIFAGEKDSIIPCSNSKLIFEKAAEPKQLVLAPNSSHNDFSADFPLYKEKLTAFLKSLQPAAN